jgi:hypothetical protein
MTAHLGIAAGLLSAMVLSATATAAPPKKEKPPLGESQREELIDKMFETEGNEEQSRLCAEQTLRQLPLQSIQTSTLKLHNIRLHVDSGYYTVLLPLLEPQGDMQVLYWGADTMEEVTTFIRLVQGHKIKALNVKAYSDELRRDALTPLSKDELQICSVETIKNLLRPCRHCEIIEWEFEGPLD